jgi:hypothetical protein
LHGVFLHPWDLEMFTKTCSNNMVSPNDHVVMNHQNQTLNKWHMRPCSLQMRDARVDRVKPRNLDLQEVKPMHLILKHIKTNLIY